MDDEQTPCWVGKAPPAHPRTRAGMVVLPYRPNASALVAGPFLNQAFADWYVDEQAERRERRRHIENRAAIVLAVLYVVAMAWIVP